MLTEAPPLQTLPPPPRPFTPRVRRRAWAEPHVRFWWLAAAALLAAGLYMGVVAYVAWRREVWLVRNGTVVQAKVEQSAGETVAGRPISPESGVLLSFDWNGQRRQTWGVLEGQSPKEVILTKSTVPIRVDPENPDRWTYRKEPPGLMADLLGAALALALAPLALLTSVALRRGVLRTWRDGEAAEAVVVARHGTALAPRARAVRCAPTDSTPEAEPPEGNAEESDAAAGEAAARGEHRGQSHAQPGGRVHTVYVPLRHTEAGEDLLRVILPPRAGGRPLAAAWFET